MTTRVATALITGVRTGLGHALAKRLLDGGATVYGISRGAPPDLVKHERMNFHALDLRRFDEIGPGLGALLGQTNALDLVLLNAGVLGELKDLASTSYDEARAVMDINVWANKALVDALMLRPSIRVAQVIGISSGAAVYGSGGWGPYSISKAALNLLLRVYAHEHPQTHFTALAPGIVETAMIHTILAQPDDARFGATTRVKAAGQEGRIMTPDEAAQRLLDSVDALRGRYDSGAYVDVRDM